MLLVCSSIEVESSSDKKKGKRTSMSCQGSPFAFKLCVGFWPNAIFKLMGCIPVGDYVKVKMHLTLNSYNKECSMEFEVG